MDHVSSGLVAFVWSLCSRPCNRGSACVHTVYSPLSQPLEYQGLAEHWETRENAKQTQCWQDAVTCGRGCHCRSDLGSPGSWGDLEIHDACCVKAFSVSYQNTYCGCHKSNLFIHPACQVLASTGTFHLPRLLHWLFELPWAPACSCCLALLSVSHQIPW